MSRRSVEDWLEDIVLWGERLNAHLGHADRPDFLANVLLQDAVSKSVKAIGEASGKLDDLDPALSERFFGIQLKQARRSRNRLAHGYHRNDLAIVRQTATESIPRLVTAARMAKDAVRRES